MAAPEPDEVRKRLYAETRTDLLKRQLSNAENYDKAILSLATATLGFSLILLKDVVATADAKSLWVLKTSWFLLFMAIIATLCSFMSSQVGISVQLRYAEKYYLQCKEEYLKKKNWPASITNYLNTAAGGFFVAATAATICFFSTNMSGDSPMTKGGMSSRSPLREGAPIPSMQAVPADREGRGAPIPAMQPAPQSQGVTQSQPAPQSQGEPSASSQSAGDAQTGAHSPSGHTP